MSLIQRSKRATKRFRRIGCKKHHTRYCWRCRPLSFHRVIVESRAREYARAGFPTFEEVIANRPDRDELLAKLNEQREQMRHFLAASAVPNAARAVEDGA